MPLLQNPLQAWRSKALHLRGKAPVRFFYRRAQKKVRAPLGMFPELPGAQSLAREIDKAIIDYYLREEEE